MINPALVVTVTVTVCGPPVGGIISAPDKIAILGERVDFLGLIVGIVVVIAVITAPVTYGKHDS